MNNKEFNEKLIKTVSENPELEIKFNISGELEEDAGCWFVGEYKSIEVGDHIEYNELIYDDAQELEEAIADDIYDEIANLSEEEQNLAVYAVAEKLEKKKVIWISVGV